MGKKILYFVVAILLVIGLAFILWSLFFNKDAKTPSNNGQFGTAGDATQNGGTNLGTSGNGQIGLGQAGTGQNTGNGSIPLNGSNGDGSIGGSTGTNGAGANGAGTGGSGSNTAGTAVGSSTVSSNGVTVANQGTLGVPGVTWLGGTSVTNSTNGTGGGAGGGNTNGFNPTGINGVNGGSIGGTVPTIGGAIADPNNSNSGINLLLASGLIGAASCALQASGNSIGSLLGAGAAATAPSAAIPAVPVNDIMLRAAAGGEAVNTVTKNTITFQSCITNVLAKAALQQITASIVNWINSGFNGSPSFVTNYQQFFTNVADLAAGQFIQGAGLSFLCSPFKLQIKVAIAQSYANRGAQSCSLTSVIRNVNGFMKGNFSQGGWQGLLSVTTMPANNPYGAYAYGQIGLASAQSNAVANAKNNISPNGFLAVQKLTCANGVTSLSPTLVAGSNSQAALSGGSGTLANGCKSSITTPGTVIEGALFSANDTSLKQLGLANSIDQILNALTTQLITKTLQNGLSSLSGTTGYQSNYQTPAQAAAQTQAQSILSTLQAQNTYSVQLGNILQGSIADIQSAQNQLNTLSNCWIVAASSTSVTAAQAATASTNSASALTQMSALNAQVDALNDSITAVNNEIAVLQQLQSEALSVASAADVATLNSDYSAAQSTGSFITQNDVTTGQQNRTTLQAQMAAINATTQAGLQQCRAFGQ